jgi:drug/metabolite transporter (DMT)-like permease
VSVVFALVAALTYGVSDFIGGLAARRDRAVLVLVVSYPVGMVLMAALLPLAPGRLGWATLGWATGAGLAGTAGVVLLYLGLAAGPMSVVAPLAALCSAVLPLGVAVGLGERPPPLAYLGVLLGLIAVALVSRGPDGGRGRDRRSAASSGASPEPTGETLRTVAIALAAGAGLGLYFVLLARTPASSGMWPLLVSRLASSVAMLVAAGAVGVLRRPAPGVTPLALAAGALDAAANAAYLLAVRHGLLALVAVVVALYPAATIVLATAVLRERTGAMQRVGLAVAAASVALIALAS